MPTVRNTDASKTDKGTLKFQLVILPLQALLEVCLHSEHLGSVVDDLQEGQEEPQIIVGELVRGLLMPSLASQCQRRDEQIEDHKFRVAARLAVEETVVGALGDGALKVHNKAHDDGKTY